MKKALTVLATLLITGILTANAQSKKEIPPPPPPPPPPEKLISPGTAEPATLSTFYRLNPSAANISWEENKIRIRLKNGIREEYDLTIEAEKKIFIEKYGVIPVPPPPPPPPKRID
jgi:hypothetical protein